MGALEKVTTPQDIERRSFEIIDGEVPEPRPFAGELWEVARRCVHALGDITIVDQLRLSEAALASGVAALRGGCRIYTDTSMLAAGLVRRRMDPLGAEVVSLMAMAGVGERALAQGITRARAAMKMIAGSMGGQVVAIGNAPTALVALLEELAAGAPAPALVVGMPVGFVNAAQSKEMLAQSPWPHFTLLGRKGGSAVAAASINAMAELALGRAGDLLGKDGRWAQNP